MAPSRSCSSRFCSQAHTTHHPEWAQGASDELGRAQRQGWRDQARGRKGGGKEEAVGVLAYSATRPLIFRENVGAGPVSLFSLTDLHKQRRQHNHVCALLSCPTRRLSGPT